MPFFSVVIPTFNRIALLSRTLESVWGQRLSDYEVIVVDDGSTDGTSKYLDRFRGRLTIIHQSNVGPGPARNAAAKNARGQYLAFLDSDDVWFPWSLELYWEIIRTESLPSFIAGKPYCFRDENDLDKVDEAEISVRRFADYLASGDEWRWWGASSFVVHRKSFMKVGGFSSEWVNGEDADLALKLGVEPGFVQIADPATFGYREHEGSAISDLERTLAGAWLNVHTEKTRGYPGGMARARERRRILTRHVRPVTVDCLKKGLWKDAWSLYRATFSWHVELSRAKYLTGFPLLALISKFRAISP